MHNPGVIRKFFHGDTGFNIDVQTSMENVQTGVAQRLLDVRFDFILALFDEFDGFVIVGAFEGEISVKHTVEDDPTSPDVDSAVDFVVFGVDKAFRSHVA